MKDAKPELTAERVRAALVANSGNVSAAAKSLGVSRPTVYDWMRRHAIKVERVVKAA